MSPVLSKESQPKVLIKAAVVQVFCSVGSFLVGNYDPIGKMLETQFEGGDPVRDDEGLH